MRRRRSRISTFAAGILAILVLGAACYFVFGGSLPFGSSPFVLRALFTSQTELHIPSPVRIAGVDVGQVTSVQRIAGSNAATITMQIEGNGLPIHADATAQIRSRIFLEGNFYVELHPGTPGAPVLSSGSTLAAAQTAGPVQLDRVLSALSSDARSNLQTLLRGLGGSLDGRASATQDAAQDTIVRGLTGGQALNASLRYSVEAFRASTIVNEALLGVAPHDLSNVVIGNQQVFKGLSASPTELASLVTTFNATMAALAAQQQNLGQTIAELPPLLRQSNAANTALDSSFAPTKQFAAALIPGLRQLDPTIGAALPWIAQATALVSDAELGGLLKQLTPAVQGTGSALSATRTFVHQSDLLARCLDHNVIPTGNQIIRDGPGSTGLKAYQEFFQGAVGLAGATGNFDGNGRYIRASAGGGAFTVHTPTLGPLGFLYGNAVLPTLGTRPAWPGHAPPLRRDVPCYTNPAPDLNSAKTGTGP